MPQKTVTLRRWQIGGAFLLLALSYFVVGLVHHNDIVRVTRDERRIANLVQENQQRIHEIQISRIKSCERTYQAFFDLFSPVIPKKQSAQDSARTKLFFHKVDVKKRGCVKQVSTGTP